MNYFFKKNNISGWINVNRNFVFWRNETKNINTFTLMSFVINVITFLFLHKENKRKPRISVSLIMSSYYIFLHTLFFSLMSIFFFMTVPILAAWCIRKLMEEMSIMSYWIIRKISSLIHFFLLFSDYIAIFHLCMWQHTEDVT